MSQGPLSQLARLSSATSHRISTYDRSGGNADYISIPKGETITFAEVNGAGMIQHIWCTIAAKDPLVRRNLVMRMYWDGQQHPSVEAPIGDFFGQGWGMKYNLVTMPLAAAPRDGNALVSYFPMPFAAGARITLENQGPDDISNFYCYVDYEQRREIPEDLGRFHAWYNQELTGPESSDGEIENEWGIFGEPPKNLTDANNYLFCECEGQGHYVGVNYYVNCPTPIWYGEGDDMFLVDGEPWPGSAHGTGSEDYFNQSWSQDEVYQHPYFGTARAPGRGNDEFRFGWLGKTHCYRFHLEDPIRFQRSLRASIEHGHGNVLTLEMASVAYWYQTLPSKPFPPLPAAEQRIPRDDITPVNIHRWREAWRNAKDRGKLWGSEP